MKTGRPRKSALKAKNYRMSIRVEIALKERAARFAERKGLPESTVHRQALVEFLDRHEKEAA